MSKALARLRYFLNQEELSVWIIVLGIGINVLAWVIPRGSYQNPSHDPFGLGALLSEVVSNGHVLHYFWHAVAAAILTVVAYAGFKIWSLGMTQLVDRCDL